MAARKAVIPQSNTLSGELSDIPLSLEQGDGEIRSAQSHKTKSNSLKRFFRKSKSQMSEDAEATPKEAMSLQLRFGTFRKNDDAKNPKSDMASGSAKSITSDSKFNLPERLSGYWNNVFKKVPKKIPAAAGDAATPVDEPPIEENSPDIQ